MLLIEEVKRQYEIRQDVEFKIKTAIDRQLMHAAALGLKQQSIHSWHLITIFQDAGVKFSTEFRDTLDAYNLFVGFVVSYLNENGFKVEVTCPIDHGTIDYVVKWY